MLVLTVVIKMITVIIIIIIITVIIRKKKKSMIMNIIIMKIILHGLNVKKNVNHNMNIDITMITPTILILHLF